MVPDKGGYVNSTPFAGTFPCTAAVILDNATVLAGTAALTLFLTVPFHVRLCITFHKVAEPCPSNRHRGASRSTLRSKRGIRIPHFNPKCDFDELTMSTSEG
ncbi:uncharacterized protein CC84DRAFT_49960 [Paraphaeosphaeria sporulosa]|uniref:Uncharacterized protein n=1 Tax=Paraphaeosphaeria sporulosa TaxID=1460663 RepID=A0A177CW30_9PLEO|nr:uncharacterized protein CC84DRAFT_49960 [Paraphaeosphaeria sporulosa]OAG11755.1 hypothetical protein CC84DRAFT_49960 [Paraphaeosphaeria sporulosa]